MNLYAARGATRSRSLTSGRDPTRSRRRALPGGRHAAHAAAGAVLAALALTAGIGWLAAPDDRGTPVAAPPPGTPELEYTAHTVPTGGITSATALILVLLILGAAVIGAVVLSPKTPPGGGPPPGVRARSDGPRARSTRGGGPRLLRISAFGPAAGAREGPDRSRLP
uniref:hypothetical protein n=1 Tax=Nocardia wallacei TaxID=480035 RepID=UPI0024577C6A